MNKDELFRWLLFKIKAVANGSNENEPKLRVVCRLLKNNLPNYDWVGFYMVNTKKENELVLGPFEGEPTEHKTIRFGDGICGQAAEKKETFLVSDVSAESNYLACSVNVKSEIVLPIFKDNNLVGELDIDSHQADAFAKEDQEFLEEVCRLIAPVL